MKRFLLGLLFSMSGHVSAESWTPVTKIVGFTMGDGPVVRVKLQDMSQHSGAELCGAASAPEISFYSLDTAGENGDKYFSTLLAAKVSKENLFFKLNGCVEQRPKISHIYVCDKLWCE